MSTSERYREYIGGISLCLWGISWVHREMFSTSEGYHKYIGECSVHWGGGGHDACGVSWCMWGVSWCMWGVSWCMWGDVISTSGGFCTSGDMMSTSGDIMIHVEGYHECIGVFSTLGGYHEYIGGWSVYWGDIMIHVGGYHEYIGGNNKLMTKFNECFGIKLLRFVSHWLSQLATLKCCKEWQLVFATLKRTASKLTKRTRVTGWWWKQFIVEMDGKFSDFLQLVPSKRINARLNLADFHLGSNDLAMRWIEKKFRCNWRVTDVEHSPPQRFVWFYKQERIGRNLCYITQVSWRR